jgi:hypothetical protein
LVLYDTYNVDVELGVGVGHMGTGVSEISPLRGLAGIRVGVVLSTFRPYGAMLTRRSQNGYENFVND